jgi:hypothetical protein
MFRYAPLGDGCWEDRKKDGWRLATRPNTGMEEEEENDDDDDDDDDLELVRTVYKIILQFKMAL